MSLNAEYDIECHDSLWFIARHCSDDYQFFDSNLFTCRFCRPTLSRQPALNHPWIKISCDLLSSAVPVSFCWEPWWSRGQEISSPDESLTISMLILMFGYYWPFLIKKNKKMTSAHFKWCFMWIHIIRWWTLTLTLANGYRTHYGLHLGTFTGQILNLKCDTW